MKKKVLKAMRAAALQMPQKVKTDFIRDQPVRIPVNKYRSVKKFFKEPANKKELHKIVRP